MLLVQQVRKALTRDPARLRCPYKDKPPAGTVTYTVPKELRGLLVAYHQRVEKVAAISKEVSREDNGISFSHQERAEALECLLWDALQTYHQDVPYIHQKRYVYYAGWRYGF